MYIKIAEYLNDLASNKPAPGGGSGAAYMGSAGAALLSMVGNFTVGKKKYRDVEDDVKAILEKTESIRSRLSELVDEDVKGYDVVTDAYAMSKDTPQAKTARSAAIQEAMKKALEVPLQICRLAHEGLGTCADLLAKGNRNLVSDVGVGALGLGAAYNGGMLNVEINLSYIKDEAFVAGIRSQIDPMTEEANNWAHEAFKGTLQKVKGG
jgi:glutamate formiminotransferase/formiminotetrahydrofolate cyclodeaminase